MEEPLLRPHPPGRKLRLHDRMAEPPRLPGDKAALEAALQALNHRIEVLQAALAAEGTRALLVVFQGRDASGKDGTVRKVFAGLNPSWVEVTSFGRPNELELRHDYLWRVHHCVPRRGRIGVFNRSHYEDVLVVRVRGLVPEAVWSRRFDQINAFERMLVEEGVAVLKFFLHVSRAEQRKRLLERLDDPTKNWKFRGEDVEERDLWDGYTAAYEDVLRRTSTKHAPWYLVPADRNKARDVLVAQVVVQALERMNPKYPRVDPAARALRDKIR